MNRKKFLLMQIRQKTAVREEEVLSFAKYLDLPATDITVLNVFDTPHFACEMIDDYDVLLVGGASEASVLDQSLNFLEDGKNLLNYCVKKSIPVFASCFGFQLAVLAFGGTITKNIDNFEMGTLKIQTSKEALGDPLFDDMGEQFFAVTVHQESALNLPSNCLLLAKTKMCCHAFRVKDKPFWAFQFHPELDKKTLIDRLGVYQKKYTNDSNHYQNIIDRLIETPKSNRLLKKFLKFVTKI